MSQLLAPYVSPPFINVDSNPPAIATQVDFKNTFLVFIKCYQSSHHSFLFENKIWYISGIFWYIIVYSNMSFLLDIDFRCAFVGSLRTFHREFTFLCSLDSKNYSFLGMNIGSIFASKMQKAIRIFKCFFALWKHNYCHVTSYYTPVTFNNC